MNEAERGWQRAMDKIGEHTGLTKSVDWELVYDIFEYRRFVLGLHLGDGLLNPFLPNVVL